MELGNGLPIPTPDDGGEHHEQTGHDYDPMPVGGMLVIGPEGIIGGAVEVICGQCWREHEDRKQQAGDGRDWVADVLADIASLPEQQR